MQTKKIWATDRDKTSPAADSFNSSLSFDKRLYRYDIEGSIAHATMLGAVGLITPDESKKITDELKKILKDIDAKSLIIDNNEDIHMWVEEVLIARIGDTGKKLHTARSRNDQVALDLRMYLRDSVKKLISELKKLIDTILKICKNNFETYMPGFTHLQHAQPTTLAHYFMAYAQMFSRDVERLADSYKRINVLPLGSCALASTTLPIDRRMVSELLGFETIGANSLDSVSDRDFAIEYLSCLSILMVHMSRISEELILWSTQEFMFVKIGSEYTTGSSIMPQKRNPDMLELIRGKTGRVFGNLTALLTVMKGLPLAYNKDMQEDKEAVFDAEDTCFACVNLLNLMLESAEFNKIRLIESSMRGFAAATEIADYLVLKNMPFREAHGVVRSIVEDCEEKKKSFEQLTYKDFAKYSALFGPDIIERIRLKNIINNRSCLGGTSTAAVKVSIDMLTKKLEGIKI